MNIRERLAAFWAGERPDVIPYTIYSYEYDASGCKDDPTWTDMFNKGLGVTVFIRTADFATPGARFRTDEYSEDGVPFRRDTISTPVGDVHQTFRNDWRHKYWIETAEDYRVMTWYAENTRVEPCHERYGEFIASMPEHFIPIPRVARTPLQEILVDFLGLENFGMHLYEFKDEMMALYDALLARFRRDVEITAAGPGPYIEVLENFTAETLGPKRYEEFLLPVYEECFPVFHQAGKAVGVHYDGKTAVCKELIARAPIDLLESLTPPPEGDLSLAEARAAWPEKLFWSNINVGAYQLPPDELRRLILERVSEAAPDSRRLAFEVSEHLPANWRESMPFVLDTLEETRTKG